MTLRIRFSGDDITDIIALDDAHPGPGCRTNKNTLSEIVKDNLALLKVAKIKDVVDNVGVRISTNTYVVCELRDRGTINYLQYLAHKFITQSPRCFGDGCHERGDCMWFTTMRVDSPQVFSYALSLRHSPNEPCLSKLDDS